MASPVNQRDLEEVFRLRHNDFDRLGWAPRMRLRFNYYSPDEYYEAVVNKLVTSNCSWLDVGCGRYVFPNNINLARSLADRCALLVGVDPDETIEENTFVHSRHRTTIEDFLSDRMFDLVTLRMVVEHFARPESVVRSLSRLTKPGGKVVVYTINRWSAVSLITWLTPFKLHHPIKSLLWGAEEKDTFPVMYRMNTRNVLLRLFQQSGFTERYFTYLDDCRSLSRFRVTQCLELSSWRVMRALGCRYPENCLLGIYERI
jgi:2-polyprenyl-3-methyl-5-hydroxy-6-metoxy-1,4-benzoquinol methylase